MHVYGHAMETRRRIEKQITKFTYVQGKADSGWIVVYSNLLSRFRIVSSLAHMRTYSICELLTKWVEYRIVPLLFYCTQVENGRLGMIVKDWS